MNILAFDTSLNKTYLALYSKGNIYSEIIESSVEKYHSAYLIKKIVELLEKQELTPQDINVLSTNIGPGSFTGIRVGLTVARAFAQGTNADVVGINSLELISKAHSQNAITILDARKNKAYVGNEKSVELIDLETLAEFLKKDNYVVISDTKMQEFLQKQNINTINFEQETLNYGEILIKITQEKLEKKLATKWQELKPLYIQPPPIHQK